MLFSFRAITLDLSGLGHSGFSLYELTTTTGTRKEKVTNIYLKLSLVLNMRLFVHVLLLQFWESCIVVFKVRLCFCLCSHEVFMHFIEEDRARQFCRSQEFSKTT